MTFKENLAQMPDIQHLTAIEITDELGNVVHTIPAVEGKLGSLKLYYALSERFQQRLDAQAAEQGLLWFAEHVEDAKKNFGKHPNIDLLLRVKQEHLVFKINPLTR